jgi:hypothetical protein
LLPENIAQARVEALKKPVLGDVRNMRGTSFMQSQREIASRFTANPETTRQQPPVSGFTNFPLAGTNSSTSGSASPPVQTTQLM